MGYDLLVDGGTDHSGVYVRIELLGGLEVDDHVGEKI